MQKEEERAKHRRIGGAWETEKAAEGSPLGSDYQIKQQMLHQQYFTMEMKVLLAGKKKPNLLFLIG